MKLTESLFDMDIEQLMEKRKERILWIKIDAVMALVQMFLCLVIYFFGSNHLGIFLSIGIVAWLLENHRDKEMLLWIDFAISELKEQMKNDH